jgi:hypothetical protein
VRLRAIVALAVSLGAGLFAVAACDDGVQANSGVGEPIIVHGAQFFPGALPGAPPIDGGSAPMGDGGAPTFPPLTVTNVGFQSPLALPGAAGKGFSGRATSDTSAIGIALAGIGSGYWVVPVQAPDGQYPGQNDFAFAADFDANDPAGRRSLLTVAIGPGGNAGAQVATPMCLESRIPDNLHACNKVNKVPRAVFTLQWDANFDLDLHVIFPDGTDVNPKSRPVAVPVSGSIPSGDPAIDRDSLRSCVPDGLRQEDLVFQDPPKSGTYLIYADPFAACGQESTRFNLIINEAGSDGNLHATFTRSGELLQMQATGGGSTGLFVAQKTYQ